MKEVAYLAKWFLQEFLPEIKKLSSFEHSLYGMLAKAEKLVLKLILKEIIRLKKMSAEERNAFQSELASIETVEELKISYKIQIF